MGDNLYDDQKFTDVINILKGLPAVNTAENFEYNLLTKIKNGNYGLSSKERRANFKVILVPSFSVAAVVFLIFLLYPSPEYEIENLLLTEPQIRQDMVSGNTLESEEFEIPAVSQNSPPGNGTNLAANAENPGGKYRVVVKPNDVVIKERIPYNFSRTESLDLDNVLANKPSAAPQNKMTKAELVSLSKSKFNFDGFFIKTHDKSIEALKAKLDSLTFR